LPQQLWVQQPKELLPKPWLIGATPPAPSADPAAFIDNWDPDRNTPGTLFGFAQ